MQNENKQAGKGPSRRRLLGSKYPLGPFLMEKIGCQQKIGIITF